jgi:hypothetical protein
LSAVRYVAFCDPSGGSGDSFALAIAHSETDRTTKVVRSVLDAIREQPPPFSPDATTAEFAALVKQYRIATVTGDRYGGEYPRERFRAHGIRVADRRSFVRAVIRRSPCGLAPARRRHACGSAQHGAG